MKYGIWIGIGIGIAALPWSVLAQPMTEATPDLPATLLVQRVLSELPQVQATRRLQTAEEARRDGLVAGPYEWNLRAGMQNRRSAPVGLHAERFTEWNAGIERTLRLPGKARVDADLGEAGVAQARIAYGDELHEAARALLKHWFDWRREEAMAAQWVQQVELLRQQSAAVQRRLTLGDAARIETTQAGAAQAQAEVQLMLAQLRAHNSAVTLRQLYPGLPLVVPPEADTESEPVPITGEPADWLAAMSEHSHEQTLARATTRRAQLQAERQQQERSADPTLGVQMSRERAGEDQIIGLTLSIPLAGDVRRAVSHIAQAEAEASAQNEAAITRKVVTEARLQYQAARSGHATWQAAHAAAGRLDEAATLIERAYRLGEGGLSDLLYARRQAHEARLAATLSRFDAREQRYRLLLDAHRLWDFEDETVPAKTP